MKRRTQRVTTEADEIIHSELVAARKAELAVERDARQQLALDSWVPPSLVDWGELTATTAEYLLHGYLERGTVGTLIGQYGMGKSFIALDWAACIAAGRKWQEHKSKLGNVLYIAAEGGQGMGRRRMAWEKEFGVEMDPEGFYFLTSPVPLAPPEGELFLTELIQKKEVDLLIIDTLARSIPGLNENDSQDMGKVIDTLYKLRDARADQATT